MELISLDENTIAYYGDTEKIPENNIEMLQKLGLKTIEELLDDGIK